MRGADGRARFAYVTFFLLNDSYLPGVLLLAHGLRRQRTAADLICMVAPEISTTARAACQLLYDRIVEVPLIKINHRGAGKRPYLPLVFTKLHALRLGADGDLGYAYEKIALLDADLLPLHHFDHLFTLSTPAGSINEHKTHVMQWGADGNFIIPPSVEKDGTWRWHEIYAACPHGQPVPRELTDRVRFEPGNMGVISSLLILQPSLTEYRAILADLQNEEIQKLVGDQFEWPEMQYFTMRWSGKWHNIDLRFHSLNGYPQLDVLNGIHYTGFKPWQFRRAGSMARYGRRADFQFWFEQYRQMLTETEPRLAEFKKLRNLLKKIETFSGQNMK
jgi:glycogenin glucosyltransferase